MKLTNKDRFIYIVLGLALIFWFFTIKFTYNLYTEYNNFKDKVVKLEKLAVKQAETLKLYAENSEVYEEIIKLYKEKEFLGKVIEATKEEKKAREDYINKTKEALLNETN